MVGLLRGAALRVDGRRRCFVGESGGEPRRAGDVEGLLARLRDAAADDLLDEGGLDARALDDFNLGRAEDLRSVETREGPVLLPDGGANSTDDDGFGHGGLRFLSALGKTDDTQN